MTGDATPTPAEALLCQLGMIARRPGELVEVRYRRPQGGMGQTFRSAGQGAALVETVLDIGARTDTYLGAAPRIARDGSKRAVTHSHALWVDCDDPGAAQRLRCFDPPATLLLRSGRAGGMHGWWALREPLAAPQALEAALARVAHHLGADMACCDAARIMRACGTLNHKHGRARPVEVERLEPGAIYTAADVVGDLPDPPDTRAGQDCASGPVRPLSAVPDQLANIAPAVYVEALTGLVPDRDGKVRCPLPGHEDGTPSLHVYPDPDRGWWCFGCERGGGVYQLAAILADYPLPLRGADFIAVRVVLLDHLTAKAA